MLYIRLADVELQSRGKRLEQVRSGTMMRPWSASISVLALGSLLIGCGDGSDSGSNGLSTEGSGSTSSGPGTNGEHGSSGFGSEGGSSGTAGFDDGGTTGGPNGTDGSDGEDSDDSGDTGGRESCPAGSLDCGGVCHHDVVSCGTEPPNSCTANADCQGLGSCVNEVCVCHDGYRACAMGCCSIDFDVTSLADVTAHDVRLAYGPDGSAWILLSVGDSLPHQLVLLRKPPLGAIENTTFAGPLISYTERSFDLAVRSDGIVAIGHVASPSPYAWFTLWNPGGMQDTEQLLASNGSRPGVSVAVDADDTTWMSYTSPQNTNQIRAWEVTLDGIRRSHTASTNGSLEQTKTVVRPGGDVYTFWGHRYTGSFVNGVAALTESPALDPYCPAEEAGFAADGTLWSVFNSYSSIYTHVCRAGTSTRLNQATLVGSVPNSYAQARMAVDGEGTMHLVAYETNAYTAHWFTTVDGSTVSRTSLPINYGNPTGSTSAAPARMASAVAPNGRVGILVVPTEPGMGTLQLYEVQ